MNLTVTHVQGGMREFERTGIYPEYLLFNLPGTRSSWRIRIRSKKQSGVLKSNSEVVYEYKFDDPICRIRAVKEDGSFTSWEKPEFMMMEMRD